MLRQTLVWTIVCLAALGLCLWRPELGRVVLGIFFIIMAIGVNVVFAPAGYIRKKGARHYFARLDPALCKVASLTDAQGIVRL
ncbi:MAG TPA: hypothetical protein VIK32_15850 [Candidatus Limnocylindrales bacterium]